MKEKKILYVSSEVVPYLAENEVSQASYDIPKMINDIGGQIRIFMPRYGNVNERRHQLHEVIRLSGMNLVINDVDIPLVIKVASIPKERIQVYFIDNDEYFKRKGIFEDEDGKLYEDNDERAIFFAKGVVETIKKLNWIPDVIHVHGWMASLLPMYMKHYYSNEKLFSDTKIVTSIYSRSFEGNLANNLNEKLLFDKIPGETVKCVDIPSCENIMKSAIDNSDAIMIGSSDVSKTLLEHINASGKPVLEYASKENLSEVIVDFYKSHVL